MNARKADFHLYVWSRGFSELSSQAISVAIGWQLYSLTNSALTLGLVGLAQFVPTALFTFLAGHAADRFDRRRVVHLCQLVEGLAAAFLAWGSLVASLNVWEIFAAVGLLGAAAAFENPASAALLPAVTPTGDLQRGAALSTAAFQIAIISGPAIGGLLFAISPAISYGGMAALWLLASGLTSAIRIEPMPAPGKSAIFKDLFAGIGFVRGNPAMLGILSLGLFAVLLGGAPALMPIYARDILHTGPWGLGVLRATPAFGALVMTALLSRRPIERKAGLRLFQAIIAFGLATIAFALSHQLWLSIAALVILGAADTVSMVIRISLVQLATPDHLRGRVGAVNFLFVHASGELGQFESGVVAALVGVVPAAFLGGLGTFIVALLWMRLFPALRAIERVE